MIKVLHCVSNMDRAGIETMLMNYYRNIDKKNFQFCFLCNKKKPGAYDDEIKSYGGKLFYSPGLNPLKWMKYHKTVKQIMLDNKFDIVHVHNGAFGLQALIAAKSAGIKVRISHAHGTRIDHNLKALLKIIYKSQLKKYATHYWGCGSEAIQYYYGKNAMEFDNTYLLKNAIDCRKFAFDKILREKIREKHNIKDNELVIGHIGRFMPQKNHTFLIEIFEALVKKDSRYKLLLIGDGELKDSIEADVNQKGLSKHVIFTGNISNANEYYQAMDLFILPSLFEGLPVVGIEAQANGLPCLMSSTVSKEVKLTKNVNFLDLKTDKEEWVNFILKMNLSRDDKVNDTIVESGYEILEATRRLEDKYQEILREG